MRESETVPLGSGESTVQSNRFGETPVLMARRQLPLIDFEAPSGHTIV